MEENPLLGPGEPTYVEDTGQIKVGDGVTPWKDLPYFHADHLTFAVSDTPPDNPPVGFVHVPAP